MTKIDATLSRADFYDAFAKLVRDRRVSMGLTQADVAIKVYGEKGTATQVNNIERRKYRRISDDTILRFREAFGITDYDMYVLSLGIGENPDEQEAFGRGMSAIRAGDFEAGFQYIMTVSGALANETPERHRSRLLHYMRESYRACEKQEAGFEELLGTIGTVALSQASRARDHQVAAEIGNIFANAMFMQAVIRNDATPLDELLPIIACYEHMTGAASHPESRSRNLKLNLAQVYGHASLASLRQSDRALAEAYFRKMSDALVGFDTVSPTDNIEARDEYMTALIIQANFWLRRGWGSLSWIARDFASFEADRAKALCLIEDALRIAGEDPFLLQRASFAKGLALARPSTPISYVPRERMIFAIEWFEEAAVLSEETEDRRYERAARANIAQLYEDIRQYEENPPV